MSAGETPGNEPGKQPGKQPGSQPFVIGVAGGTGSGKTTVSRRIQEAVNINHIAYIQHDNYYRDQAQLSMDQRVRTNYDHPDSLETELLVQHLVRLRAGQAIDMPMYDFSIHTRSAETQHVEPAPIILLEGILIFVEKELRELMTRIFVDTDADIRFIRRRRGDMNERGGRWTRWCSSAPWARCG
ncbi:MAG: uridine kinase [Caldilineaceae bacterium]